MISVLQIIDLKFKNILNGQGNTQRTPTAIAATNVAGPSNQSCSRRRSTPIVAANVNEGEIVPRTQPRSRVAQALGS